MKQTIFRSASLLAAVALFAAFPASARAQQFQQYVALGDSLTAGWQSGCLVQRNQLTSYPAVLASILLDGDFEMPLVQEVALSGSGSPQCLGAVFVPPASLSVEPMSEMDGPLNALLPRPYNDLGIPGAEVADLTTLTHGDANGTDLEKLSALVLRNVTGSPFDGTSAVNQAGALLAPAASSAIATLWIGSNNTLGASTSGIVVDGVTLVSQADFQASYSAIIAGIPPGVQLIVANISDVTSIPFSTTIPPVLVDPATRQPVIVNGSVVPLLGPGDAGYPCTPVPPDQGCGLPPGSLVNLPASSLLGQGIGIPVAAGGTGLPLPHGSVDGTGAHPGVVLYPDDIALLEQKTSEYNSVIANSSGDAVLVDTNTRFNEISQRGYSLGGITLTTSFLTGGIFSYDGVHPSTIGYTIVASEFIKAINDQTGSSYRQPNFSNALFTPNPPDPSGGASLRSGGPWHYTFDMWKDVMASTVSSRVMQVTMPSAPPAPRMVPVPPAGRPTRTVGRQVED